MPAEIIAKNVQRHIEERVGAPILSEIRAEGSARKTVAMLHYPHLPDETILRFISYLQEQRTNPALLTGVPKSESNTVKNLSFSPDVDERGLCIKIDFSGFNPPCFVIGGPEDARKLFNAIKGIIEQRKRQ